MIVINALVFSVALLIYGALWWKVGPHLYSSGWPSEVVTILVTSFLLIYGAILYLVVRGGLVVRLVFVALLSPLTLAGFYLIFGGPFQTELAIERGTLLLIGGGLGWVYQKIAL